MNSFLVLLVILLGVALLCIVVLTIVCVIVGAIVVVVIVVRVMVVFVEVHGLWLVWHAGGCLVIVAVSVVQVLWC